MPPLGEGSLLLSLIIHLKYYHCTVHQVASGIHSLVTLLATCFALKSAALNIKLCEMADIPPHIV